MHRLAVLCHFFIFTIFLHASPSARLKESSYSGYYLPIEEEGVYLCASCNLPLFSFENQYDAGNGWPSFTYPIAKKTVYYREDWSLGFKRYEVLCRGCDSALGHVFYDGPPPKHLRFCIHSNCLKIEFKD